MMITANAGSSGYLSRLFKDELSELAQHIGFEITICHFLVGTLKTR